MKATEDYVSFETAKALRAIGFNCPCCHYYKRSKWVRRGRFPSKKISPQMYKGYADLIKEAPKIEFINDEGITNQRLTGNDSQRRIGLMSLLCLIMNMLLLRLYGKLKSGCVRFIIST